VNPIVGSSIKSVDYRDIRLGERVLGALPPIPLPPPPMMQGMSTMSFTIMAVSGAGVGNLELIGTYGFFPTPTMETVGTHGWFGIIAGTGSQGGLGAWGTIPWTPTNYREIDSLLIPSGKTVAIPAISFAIAWEEARPMIDFNLVYLEEDTIDFRSLPNIGSAQNPKESQAISIQKSPNESTKSAKKQNQSRSQSNF